MNDNEKIYKQFKHKVPHSPRHCCPRIFLASNILIRFISGVSVAFFHPIYLSRNIFGLETSCRPFPFDFAQYETHIRRFSAHWVCLDVRYTNLGSGLYRSRLWRAKEPWRFVPTSRRLGRLWQRPGRTRARVFGSRSRVRSLGSRPTWSRLLMCVRRS